MARGAGRKDPGGSWAGIFKREGGCLRGRDIPGRGAARLKQRQHGAWGLQGKAEGEGEVLSSLPHMQRLGRQFAKGFPPSCPFAAPQLERGSLELPQTRGCMGMCLHPSPFPAKPGVNMPHAEAQAPHFPTHTPHGPHVP